MIVSVVADGGWTVVAVVGGGDGDDSVSSC